MNIAKIEDNVIYSDDIRYSTLLIVKAVVQEWVEKFHDRFDHASIVFEIENMHPDELEEGMEDENIYRIRETVISNIAGNEETEALQTPTFKIMVDKLAEDGLVANSNAIFETYDVRFKLEDEEWVEWLDIRPASKIGDLDDKMELMENNNTLNESSSVVNQEDANGRKGEETQRPSESEESEDILPDTVPILAIVAYPDNDKESAIEIDVDADLDYDEITEEASQRVADMDNDAAFWGWMFDSEEMRERLKEQQDIEEVVSYE